jgi:lipopolysaccharide biosynthesis glycosyltransferase
MFIMKKDIFHDYCAWLFPILERYCQTHDMSRYSRETLRTPGHLGERLLNIYLLHHERIGVHWKTKQCQCVHFENTTPFRLPTIPSELETRFKPSIPVVLASDNNYVPMLATTMYSMLANASDAYHYHIIVLTSDISHENQVILTTLAQQMRTASVQFVDVTRLLDIEELSTNNPHISVETYYRFLIQDILPDFDKVIYLDSDLIVQDDISKLYGIELGNNLIAAVRDVDYLGNLNLKDSGRFAYTKTVLGMDNPYDYFQAGVLVLNTKALRKDIPSSIWLEEAKDTRYIYNDQDILNARCEGRVTFLDPAWNVMHDGCQRINAACSHAPAPVFQEYLDARSHEKIIHYAGAEKPWNTLNCDRALEYWLYARKTPFYEKLLAFLSSGYITEQENEEYQLISDDSIIRKIADPILPPDSRPREILRSIAIHAKRLMD